MSVCSLNLTRLAKSLLLKGNNAGLTLNVLPGPVSCHKLNLNNSRGTKSYKDPPKYDHVEFPLWDKRKLPLLAKVPQFYGNAKPRKMAKRLIDIRGPELVHNKLIHKQFGVQALVGGNLRFGHIESSRLKINRKMDINNCFAVWRIDPPWKPVTKKGIGVRMGGGKGAIKLYVTPVKADRIILEMGGTVEFEDVKHILKVVAHNLPFPARVVTQQMLEEEEIEKKKLEEQNINPFSFEYAVNHNMLGCQQHISKYDYIWHNRYR